MSEQKLIIASNVNRHLDELKAVYARLPQYLVKSIDMQTEVANELAANEAYLSNFSISVTHYPQLGFLLAILAALDGSSEVNLESNGMEFQVFPC
jgi:predicted O-methyltransferase YrrM